MARCTADLVEYLLSALRVGGCHECCIHRGCHGRAHELREVINVRHVRRAIGDIFGVGGSFAESGAIGWVQAAGDSLLVHIGVPCKRQQAGMLIFPTKLADGGLSRRFADGNLDRLSTDPSVVIALSWAASVSRVLSGMASTKPSPKVFSDILKVWMVSAEGTRS